MMLTPVTIAPVRRRSFTLVCRHPSVVKTGGNAPNRSQRLELTYGLNDFIGESKFSFQLDYVLVQFGLELFDLVERKSV
jgi:hypothetical protein